MLMRLPINIEYVYWYVLMFKTAWINNSFNMWWPKRNDTKHKHNFSLWKATKQWRNRIYAHVFICIFKIWEMPREVHYVHLWNDCVLWKISKELFYVLWLIKMIDSSAIDFINACLLLSTNNKCSVHYIYTETNAHSDAFEYIALAVLSVY